MGNSGSWLDAKATRSSIESAKSITLGDTRAFCTIPPTPPMPRIGGRAECLTMERHSLQDCASSPLTNSERPLPCSVGRLPGSIVSVSYAKGPSPYPSSVLNGVVNTASPRRLSVSCVMPPSDRTVDQLVHAKVFSGQRGTLLLRELFERKNDDRQRQYDLGY